MGHIPPAAREGRVGLLLFVNRMAEPFHGEPDNNGHEPQVCAGARGSWLECFAPTFKSPQCEVTRQDRAHARSLACADDERERVRIR